MSSVDLKVKGTFDSKQLESGLKDLDNSLKSVSSDAQKADKSMSEMLKVKNSTTNYRRQLKDLTRQIQDLTIQYRSLSDAERNSDFGRALGDKIQQMTKQASQYQDAIMDVQQSIRNAASDTQTWDAAVQGMGVLTGAAQSLVGVLGLSGEKSEALLKTLTAMKSIESVFTTFKRLQNALQGQSALMQTLNRLGIVNKKVNIEQATSATVAATANNALSGAEASSATAGTALAGANAKAAVSTTALAGATTVLKIALGGLGIGLLAAGIALVTKRMKEYKEESKKATEINNEISKSFAATVAQLKVFVAQYNELDVADRTEWFNKNKNAIEELLGPMKNLEDFEERAITRGDDYIAMLYKRATATVLLKKYQEELEKVIEDTSNAVANWGDNDAASRYITNSLKYAVEDSKELQRITNLLKDVDFSAMLGGSSGGSGGDKIEAAAGSIEDFNKKIQEQTKIMNNVVIGSEEYKRALEAIAGLELSKKLKMGDMSAFDVKLTVKPLVDIDYNKFNSDLEKEIEASLDSFDIVKEFNIDLKPISGEFENAAKEIEKWIPLVSSVTSIFDSLGDSIEGVGGKIFKMTGVIASTAGALAQQIAENKKLVASEAAKAGAKGISSVMDLPFPANVIAIAPMIATLVGAFASIMNIAKFATGGIVGGSSYNGDNMLIRANSGEMVLNNWQQSNLWDMLNAPFSGNVAGGEVKFRIENDALVGVLDNYMIKRGRI